MTRSKAAWVITHSISRMATGLLVSQVLLIILLASLPTQNALAAEDAPSKLPHQQSSTINNQIPTHYSNPFVPTSNASVAEYEVPNLIQGDQIWWIGSSGVVGQLRSTNQLTTYRFRQGGWVPAATEQFIQAQNDSQQQMTLFYIHGNRTNAVWSVIRGVQVYNNVLASNRQRAPVRFVIWHWPANTYPLPIQEFEENADRAVIHGRHFARFLQFLDPNQPTGFVGYSLGSQFLLSAAEQVDRFAEQGCPTARKWKQERMRLAVIASVTSCHWPTQPNQLGRAGQLIKSALVIENRYDLALNFFRVKCITENPRCLKRPCAFKPFRKFGAEIVHAQVGNSVGKIHSIDRYTRQEFVQQSLLRQFQLVGPQYAAAMRESQQADSIYTEK